LQDEVTATFLSDFLMMMMMMMMMLMDQQVWTKIREELFEMTKPVKVANLHISISL